jgi:hypothetical protein
MASASGPIRFYFFVKDRKKKTTLDAIFAIKTYVNEVVLV